MKFCPHFSMYLFDRRGSVFLAILERRYLFWEIWERIEFLYQHRISLSLKFILPQNYEAVGWCSISWPFFYLDGWSPGSRYFIGMAWYRFICNSINDKLQWFLRVKLRVRLTALIQISVNNLVSTSSNTRAQILIFKSLAQENRRSDVPILMYQKFRTSYNLESECMLILLLEYMDTNSKTNNFHHFSFPI